jgi:hypothetical protein
MKKNKHLKQSLQHSKNQNWKEFLSVLKKLGLYEIYLKLPKEAQGFIRKARFTSVRIEASPGSRLGQIIEAARSDFRHMLQTETMEIPGTGQKFTFHELLVEVYSCVLATVQFYDEFTHKPIGGQYTTALQEWADKVHSFYEWIYSFNSGIDSPFNMILNELSNAVCMCDRGYYWFARRRIPPTGVSLVKIFYLHYHEPQTEKVILDGKIRTVYRLAIAKTCENLKWISISAKTMGLESSNEFPVYLQMHALNRARERLAPLRNSTVEQLFVNACLKPEIEVRNGYYNMVVRLDGCKIGYILFTLCESALVGRTFLFVTQSGTPEGQLINDRFEIGAYEKEYLKIDRLSTFLQSDILYDKYIASMLKVCGCEELVALKNHVIVETSYAAHLRKTLCLDELISLEDESENINGNCEIVKSEINVEDKPGTIIEKLRAYFE